ncbi:MAG: NAD(P)H-dependent glycerol-3-phosphate dehydrogenase [Eubacteriales bacterium]|nr:NAD(P)H-dependent glycerol-3-phosphate dehydrogenase [Eubacteriales bacterium]
MAKTGVIGAGSWGLALARLLSKNGHETTVWSHREEGVRDLRENREHRTKLPGVKLPEDIVFTSDLEEAVRGKELLVLAVPSLHTRSTCRRMAPYAKPGQLVVSVSKGIEESTLMIQTDIIRQELPAVNAAVLSGPSHAEEVGRDIPTTVVAGAKDRSTAEYIQNVFMNQVFRVYTSPDMLGIELGGALKNVIALAAGVADGLGCGDNTKAALITRGIAEMSRLGVAMGGHIETFNGLTGIGDLIVTCASRHSRNRRAGYLIGQGMTMQQAMDEVQMVVEGVYSARAAKTLAEQYGISMPIVQEVNRVLFEDKPAREAMADLMLRDKKIEHPELPWGNA